MHPRTRLSQYGTDGYKQSRRGHSVQTRLKVLPALAALTICVSVMTQNGSAIPAFSRQYATSCMTCHIDFPKLNDFGKAFKDAGFVFPKGD